MKNKNSPPLPFPKSLPLPLPPLRPPLAISLSSLRDRFVATSPLLPPPNDTLEPLVNRLSTALSSSSSSKSSTSPSTKSEGARWERHVEEPLSWMRRSRSDSTLRPSNPPPRVRSTSSHQCHTSRRRECRASRSPTRKCRPFAGFAAAFPSQLRRMYASSPAALTSFDPPWENAMRCTSAPRTEEFQSLMNERRSCLRIIIIKVDHLIR